MTAQGWLQIALFVAVLTALTPVLGAYMARVYQGEPVALGRVLGPVERLVYRGLGVDPEQGQDWKAYGRSVLVFSAVSFVVLYVILRTQGIHPFNPEGFSSGTWDVSFNTTASFVSNTNWQFYGGETTLSYFSQMAGLTVQNFVSAAVGMAVLAAVIRGFAARGVTQLGNFWRDLTRTLLYILLPLSFVGALVLVSQGVIQTLGTADGLALGPAASQVSIKQLGTNGGGFFNVNSAMPFENPTAFSNFVELLFILLIPAALTATFGRMVGNRRQGWALFGAMAVMLVASIAVTYAAEQNGSPAQKAAGVETAAQDGGTGGNLEGKEQRFGVADSSLWAAVTTAASNGSVNSAPRRLHRHRRRGAAGEHDDRRGDLRRGRIGPLRDAALRPAGGVHRRADGGAHARVPGQEDRGAGGQAGADRRARRAAGGAVRDHPCRGDQVRSPVDLQPGPQGFSETLYAYTSQANNNGSAFAGYTGFVQPNAPGNKGAFGISFADLAGGLSMLGGRFVPLLAALAVAGSLAAKRPAPLGRGHLPHRYPDVLGSAHRRDHHRRRAHLLPCPAPRPRRPGPDHAAVLMRRELTTSVIAVLAFTLVLGLAYPLLTTGAAQVLFGDKADGSQVDRGGKLAGSRLIGQDFKGRARWFQSRPSATEYDPAGTFFNNLGPNSKELRDLFKENLDAYLGRERRYSPGLTARRVPVDAVTTSGSGVDPHISQANARIQARRVAAVRRIPQRRVLDLVDENTDGRFLGVLGEPGVNVLELNLAIERASRG